MIWLIMISAWIIFWIFMLFRNRWLYKKRIEIINKDSDKMYKILFSCKTESDLKLYDKYSAENREYNKLWSYNKMWWHFWIWDIEKMKNT